MKSSYKIIFTGPVGAGKTTAISAISDHPAVTTEEAISDGTKFLKTNTTVALDYGAIALKNGIKIHLYGTPGQERFDFMWDILTKNGSGLILLVDGSDKNALNTLRFFLKKFKYFIARTNIVVGITKQDIKKHYELDDYREVLSVNSPAASILEINAQNRNDIAALIESLLSTFDPAPTF